MATAEWLPIVEAQQRELQELRSQAASTPRSVSSSSSNAGDLDLERFADVCGQLEAARQRVARRDVTCRELRARVKKARDEIEQWRQGLEASQAQSQMLQTQLDSERAAKQEAVDRAAQAMIHVEELAFKLQDAAHATQSLRSELRLQREFGRELERKAGETHTEVAESRKATARMEANLRLAQKEIEALTQQLQQQRDQNTSHVCENGMEDGLQSRLVELERVLTLQTAQLEKQQHAIIGLHETNTRLIEQHSIELTNAHNQITRQLNANIALERAVNQHVCELQDLKDSLRESEDRGRMQVEEMQAYAAWRRSAIRRECSLEVVQCEAKEAKEKMERVVRHLEASRRRVLGELATTKRQLAQLQTAMQKVDGELQGMSKTFSLFRTREAYVTRTLREYGRRNRTLQEAVKQMSSKVLLLSQSLLRSERRKQQVVSESHVLKRGLVAERCQREDLLQQCIELEECLSAFQQAAHDSAVRAQSVEKENAVLHHAVTQLCAYSRELTESQQALQSELKQLEVQGRVEPAVFG